MMLVPSQDKSASMGHHQEKGSLTKVDITEASAADLTPNTILVTHAKILETQKSVVSGSLRSVTS